MTTAPDRIAAPDKFTTLDSTAVRAAAAPEKIANARGGLSSESTLVATAENQEWPYSRIENDSDIARQEALMTLKVDGTPLFYFDDPAGWKAQFIRIWNSHPEVTLFPFPDMTTLHQNELWARKRGFTAPGVGRHAAPILSVLSVSVLLPGVS